MTEKGPNGETLEELIARLEPKSEDWVSEGMLREILDLVMVRITELEGPPVKLGKRP